MLESTHSVTVDELSRERTVHLVHGALILPEPVQLTPSMPSSFFRLKEGDYAQSLMVTCTTPASCATLSKATDGMFSDPTFIKQLMECNFEHDYHHYAHGEQLSCHANRSRDNSDDIHVDPVANMANHINAHHDHDHINPDADCVVYTLHEQDADNLHAHAHHRRKQSHALVNGDDGIHVEPTVMPTDTSDASSLRAHSGEYKEKCRTSHDDSHVADVNITDSMHQSIHAPHVSSLHAQIYEQQTDVTKGLQAHNNSHCISTGLTDTSSTNGNGSESEVIYRSFLHCFDVTNVHGFSPVPSSKEGLINHLSETEQLKHGYEDSIEKTHIINLKLLHLLLTCAEAVSEDNLELASVVLSRLQELSCEYGSPLQRLSFYLSDALEARIDPSAQEAFQRSLRMCLPPCDMLESFCVFYNVNPIGRFCHLTLNQLILDNTMSDTHIHLVDLHTGYGMQWAAFLQAVALGPRGHLKLRLTSIGPSEEQLISTGRKLMDMARSLQVSFEYCPIAIQLHSFDARMIDLRQDEVCMINSLGQLHTLLHRGSASVDKFLAGLRSMEPKVLVIAENDVSHNNPLFLSRFVECLKYYAAVFESLDAALPPTSQVRSKIERMLCGPKIGSIVACNGSERHETMYVWMRILERAGFRNAQLTQTAINQAKLLLNLYYPNGYSLTQDHGTLTLRWKGTALMAIGIWH